MTRRTVFRSPYIDPCPRGWHRDVILSVDWVSWALRRLAESAAWDARDQPCGDVTEADLLEGYGVTDDDLKEAEKHGPLTCNPPGKV